MGCERNAIANHNFLVAGEVVKCACKDVGMALGEQLFAQLLARRSFRQRLGTMVRGERLDNPGFQIGEDRRCDEHFSRPGRVARCHERIDAARHGGGIDACSRDEQMERQSGAPGCVDHRRGPGQVDVGARRGSGHREPAASRGFARDDVENLLQQPHRGPVRKKIERRFS